MNSHGQSVHLENPYAYLWHSPKLSLAWEISDAFVSGIFRPKMKELQCSHAKEIPSPVWTIPLGFELLERGEIERNTFGLLFLVGGPLLLRFTLLNSK